MESRNALILYGSETGNAQDIAQELAELCERLHFTTFLNSLNNVKVVCSAQPCLPSIHATTNYSY